MIKCHRVLCCIALIATTGDVGFCDDATKLIRDPDPAVRIEAWRSIAKDSQEVVQKADQILPLLPTGFRDSDLKVRSQATKMAAVLGMASYKHRTFPFSSNPEVAEGLLQLLNDKDAGVRQTAVQAITLGVDQPKASELRC